MQVPLIVYAVVVTALAFDFTNGFHDTANAMAPSIATGAFKPKTAVLVSAVLNLVGAFLSVQVASTISGGIVDESKFQAGAGPYIVFGALVGAIVWNLLTWYLGIPSSSSHALFGGLIGATFVAVGSDAVNLSVVVQKVLLPAVISPIIAGVAAATGTMIAYRTNENLKKKHVSRGFRAGQNISASLVSLAHGTNDAQKTMGIIALTLLGATQAGQLDHLPGFLSFLHTATPAPGKELEIAVWIKVACALTMAAGTAMGGWRIIRTLGHKMVKLQPISSKSLPDAIYKCYNIPSASLDAWTVHY